MSPSRRPLLIRPLTGLLVALVGVVGALANHLAARAFPDFWGGPNIGAGFLQLICYALVVLGVLLWWRARNLDPNGPPGQH